MLYYKVAYKNIRALVLGVLALTYNPDTRKQLGLSFSHIHNQTTLNKTHLTYLLMWLPSTLLVHMP